MENEKKVRGKIRYILKKDISKIDLALPNIIDDIRRLNRSIIDKESEYKKARGKLSSEANDLKRLLRKRDQFVVILQTLNVISSKRTKNLDKNGTSPSEYVSLNNPRIEVYSKEEILILEKEERETRERIKTRQERDKREEDRRNSRYGRGTGE